MEKSLWVKGFSRISKKEKIQFLYTALGSLTEVQNLLMLSRDFKYIELSKYNELINLTNETGKLINGLIRSIKTSFWLLSTSSYLLTTISITLLTSFGDPIVIVILDFNIDGK